MPCVVEICFPIRDSACILVRSKLVKSQEEKKQRLGQNEESKSETKDERHFLPTWVVIEFGALPSVPFEKFTSQQFQPRRPSSFASPLSILVSSKKLSLNSDRLRQDLDSPKLAARAAAGSIFQTLTKRWKHLWSNRRKIKKLKASCCGKRRWI